MDRALCTHGRDPHPLELFAYLGTIIRAERNYQTGETISSRDQTVHSKTGTSCRPHGVQLRCVYQLQPWLLLRAHTCQGCRGFLHSPHMVRGINDISFVGLHHIMRLNHSTHLLCCCVGTALNVL